MSERVIGFTEEQLEAIENGLKDKDNKIQKLESDLQKAEAKIRDLNSKCGHLGIKADNYLQDKIKASERNTLLENEIKELVKHNSRSDEELQEAKKEIGFKEQAIIKAHIEIRDRGKWVKAKNKELKEVKEELSGLQRLYDELVKNGKRLVKDRDKAIECLRFYGDKNQWCNGEINTEDWYDVSEEKDRGYFNWYGGKKARITLKEITGE
jgi:chromosome segregation ATPase